MDGRPNILFFFPDQHRPDWVGWNMDLPLRTPNIDQLARAGVRFDNAYCTSPLCAPSRASVASGRHYGQCGVWGNHQNYPLEQPTYYRSLRGAGYQVAGVGKFDLHKDTRDPANLDWHLDGSRLIHDWGFTQGIDNEGKLDGSNSYRAAGEPKGPYLKFLSDRGLADIYVQEHDRIPENMGAYTTALPDDAYCDNWLSENGLAFLKSFPSDEPWHLVINFTGPHGPMDVTASMRERWKDIEFPAPHDNSKDDPEGLLRNRQNYAAMIENIDRQVGRFLEVVRERGEEDRTLVVYASDHGEMLGDHGRFGKSVWYQASSRVPLIISGPGIGGGVATSALVSLHDLAATFVDYAGSAPMPQMDAVSLRGVLQKRRDSHRPVVVSGLDHWRMVFDGRFKLVLGWSDHLLLFDLAEDPMEDHDVAGDHPDIVDRLRMALN